MLRRQCTSHFPSLLQGRHTKSSFPRRQDKPRPKQLFSPRNLHYTGAFYCYSIEPSSEARPLENDRLASGKVDLAQWGAGLNTKRQSRNIDSLNGKLFFYWRCEGEKNLQGHSHQHLRFLQLSLIKNVIQRSDHIIRPREKDRGSVSEIVFRMK